MISSDAFVVNVCQRWCVCERHRQHDNADWSPLQRSDRLQRLLQGESCEMASQLRAHPTSRSTADRARKLSASRSPTPRSCSSTVSMSPALLALPVLMSVLLRRTDGDASEHAHSLDPVELSANTCLTRSCLASSSRMPSNLASLHTAGPAPPHTLYCYSFNVMYAPPRRSAPSLLHLGYLRRRRPRAPREDAVPSETR